LTVFIVSVIKNIPSPFCAWISFRRMIPGFYNCGRGIFVICFSFEGRYWESSRKSTNGIN
jgi:hypothetical protein